VKEPLIEFSLVDVNYVCLGSRLPLQLALATINATIPFTGVPAGSFLKDKVSSSVALSLVKVAFVDVPVGIRKGTHALSFVVGIVSDELSSVLPKVLARTVSQVLLVVALVVIPDLDE